ncbi:MAG: dolichyl-P-Man:Man(5)GlcNAc(2)-PP-dolichol alpha-1,3-mannosyltransferase [Chrysothrix sp. TS-e1954]|nr:MAG: dolichyl-P-Man:Man(5)GlcNAc(2)-PP-dolichol alpha-1,3-mannosyltransferase [Chrysothrix sp. TS-e1954]
MDRKSVVELYAGVLDIAVNPKHTKWVAPVLLLMDAVLCALIIRTVSYTEIDWVAYMQQVRQVNDRERDYTMIKGDTGPLVYPAIHVYLYRALHFMTQQGTNIVLAQIIFAIVYIFNLGMAMACYNLAEAPPWILPMLVLSKRLHSIYVLRCFNDCFAMSAFFIAVYCYQRKHWSYGSVAFSCGLGIKMNLLLVLPGILTIMYQSLGPVGTIIELFWMLQIQVLSALPFFRANPRGYLTRAFDLSREFQYKWTVNWKFVPEDVFLSRKFAFGLLILHVAILTFFMFTRWLQPLGRSPKQFIFYMFTTPSKQRREIIEEKLSPQFILTVLLSSNAIGMLCARTLHYQFFSWIAWATPFLLWRSGISPLLQVVVWLGQELAWDQYPSNPLSSKIVVGVLAVVLVEVWLATDETEEDSKAKKQATINEALRRESRGRPKKSTAIEETNIFKSNGQAKKTN